MWGTWRWWEAVPGEYQARQDLSVVSGCVAGPRLELQHNKQTKEEEEAAEKENRKHRVERERERAGYPLDSGIILAQAKLIKGFTQFMANVKRIRTFCVPALTCYSGNQRPPARPTPPPLELATASRAKWNTTREEHLGECITRGARARP